MFEIVAIGILSGTFALATIVGAIVTGDRPNCWPFVR